MWVALLYKGDTFCKGELPFAPTMLLQSYTTYPKDEYGNR